jgi:ATP phosphoribosyltransferase regulatory subunit
MFRLPDGFKDLLPYEAEVFYFIHQKLYSTFTNFGYSPIIPSSVEYIKTYTYSKEPEEQIFNFIDSYDNRTACFRFDFTPQVVRIITSDKNFIKNIPYRVCYFGPVLRNPENYTGLPREIHHAGVELIGLEGIKAEIELIAIVKDIEKHLQLKSEIKLIFNDNEILKMILQKTGLYKNPNLKEALIVRDITAIKNITEKTNIERSLKNFIIDLPISCGDVSLIEYIEKKYKIEFLKPYTKKLKDLAYFVSKNLNKNIYFDLGEVRGFEYHTGITFDGYAQDNNGKVQDVITGGRYDSLLEIFSKKSIAATGFAIDIMKLANCINYQSTIKVAILTNETIIDKAFKVAEILRGKGIRVTIISDYKERHLKNKFDYILILDNNNMLFLKNCKKRKVSKITWNDLIIGNINELFYLERSNK